MPDQPQRPARPGSSPKIQGAEIEADRILGGAPNQKRQDLPKQTATLPNMAALRAPPLFPQPEAPTVPAPNPLQHQTIRRPTPPAVVAAARRTPLPPRDESPPTTDAPRSRSEAREVILEGELAKGRARIAELERDARAGAEAKQATYPPKVEQRRPSPPVGTRAESASTPPDAAIGKSVRFLLGKLWPFFLAAAGIGGGVTAVAKPSADPAKADATLANIEAMRADLSLIREQLSGVLKREAARDAYLRCVDEGLTEIGSQLLPAQDHAGAAQPLRAYVDRCQRLRP